MSHHDDIATLEHDASLDEPLRRVAYEAGMLLGLEAARDEQDYHRRRLTRAQYWLHGAGTVAGMVISLAPASSDDPGPVAQRLLVGPGIGIDGLGREVLVHEPYCIDLGAWLRAQSETALRQGYDESGDPNQLWLKVTVRYQDCPSGAQPVLARKLNLSTDAVQPSRTSDSVLLELVAELPAAADERYRPWGGRPPLGTDLPELSDAEQAQIAAEPNASSRELMRLQAQMLHAFDGRELSVQGLAEELEEGARLLLCRIAIDLPDLNVILDAHEGEPVVNPAQIHINNLARPFLVTPSQLAWLARGA